MARLTLASGQYLVQIEAPPPITPAATPPAIAATTACGAGHIWRRPAAAAMVMRRELEETILNDWSFVVGACWVVELVDVLEVNENADANDEVREEANEDLFNVFLVSAGVSSLSWTAYKGQHDTPNYASSSIQIGKSEDF